MNTFVATVLVKLRAARPLLGAIAAAAVCASAWPEHSAAASDVFTMGNYPVEARAKDGVTAKNTALAVGQQAALRSLFRRLVPVMSYKRLKDLSGTKSADLIDGVGVRSERNSPTEYIATLDFSFQAQGIRDVLRRNQVPFVDQQAPETILVPLYRPAAGAPYESGKGFWYDAWAGLDLDHTLTPLKLAPLNPAVSAETVQSLITGQNGADRTVSGEYKSPRVILAIAEPDAAGKKLQVTLVGTDAVGPFTLPRVYRLGANDRGYTAELAAIVGLGVVEGRWKTVKAGPDETGGADTATGGSDGPIQLLVQFESISEWNDIRTRLLGNESAYDFAIGAVSSRSAEVSLRYPSGARGLSQALSAQGLTMTQNGPAWIVRATF